MKETFRAMELCDGVGGPGLPSTLVCKVSVDVQQQRRRRDQSKNGPSMEFQHVQFNAGEYVNSTECILAQCTVGIIQEHHAEKL